MGEPSGGGGPARIRAGVGAMEIGGSHVTGAVVEEASGTVHRGSTVRHVIDPGADADALLGVLGSTGRDLVAGGARSLAIAVPGPFEYDSGVARFSGVGKFESLFGQDLRQELSRRTSLAPHLVRFANDGEAFGIGEALDGEGAGRRSFVALTLGTGVGSCFVRDRTPQRSGPGVAPNGEVHLLRYRGMPLEDTVSSRALIAAYRELGPDAAAPQLTVESIFAAARRGERRASTVVTSALEALGEVLAPNLREFEAEALIIGGGISGAWDLVKPGVLRGLRNATDDGWGIDVLRAADTTRSALVGVVELTGLRHRP